MLPRKVTEVARKFNRQMMDTLVSGGVGRCCRAGTLTFMCGAVMLLFTKPN